ncbi:MAG: hypothetical protein ACOCXA_09705, partial [Planctomycetota bacterium]
HDDYRQPTPELLAELAPHVLQTDQTLSWRLAGAAACRPEWCGHSDPAYGEHFLPLLHEALAAPQSPASINLAQVLHGCMPYFWQDRGSDEQHAELALATADWLRQHPPSNWQDTHWMALKDLALAGPVQRELFEALIDTKDGICLQDPLLLAALVRAGEHDLAESALRIHLENPINRFAKAKRDEALLAAAPAFLDRYQTDRGMRCMAEAAIAAMGSTADARLQLLLSEIDTSSLDQKQARYLMDLARFHGILPTVPDALLTRAAPPALSELLDHKQDDDRVRRLIGSQLCLRAWQHGDLSQLPGLLQQASAITTSGRDSRQQRMLKRCYHALAPLLRDAPWWAADAERLRILREILPITLSAYRKGTHSRDDFPADVLVAHLQADACQQLQDQLDELDEADQLADEIHVNRLLIRHRHLDAAQIRILAAQPDLLAWLRRCDCNWSIARNFKSCVNDNDIANYLELVQELLVTMDVAHAWAEYAALLVDTGRAGAEQAYRRAIERAGDDDPIDEWRSAMAELPAQPAGNPDMEAMP